MAKKFCTLCGERPRQVPDRNKPGNFALKICRECHADRLRADLRIVMDKIQKRKEMLGG